MSNYIDVKIANIIGRNHKYNSTEISSLENFKIDSWDYGLFHESILYHYKPFCVHNDSLLLLDTESIVYSKPFFYSSQRDLANKVLSIDCQQLNNEINQEEITFIFSIGRCGSTLLSKVLGTLGMLEVSECDVFSLTRNQLLINSTISIFQNYSYNCNGNISFKFRSHVGANVKFYIEKFPNSKFIFLYREKSAWAKSCSSKFNHNVDVLKRNYNIGYDCLFKLIESDVNLTIVSYENLINDYSIFSKSDTDLEKIKKVMSQDSQSGVIDNNRSTYSSNVVESFLSSCEKEIEDLV